MSYPSARNEYVCTNELFLYILTSWEIQIHTSYNRTKYNVIYWKKISVN